MTTDARTAALDMRERCAELLEGKAESLMGIIEGPSKTHDRHTHYGRSIQDQADQLKRAATDIRALPLVTLNEAGKRDDGL